MTLSELKSKDVINLADGRLLGKCMDLEFCLPDGNITALVVPGDTGFFQMIKGEKTGLVIPWCRIEKIGDDVILVNADSATS